MLSLFNVQEAVMPSDINPVAMSTHEYKYHKPFNYSSNYLLPDANDGIIWKYIEGSKILCS